MTPEERAKQVHDEYFPNNDCIVPCGFQLSISRAIRAAEDEAVKTWLARMEAPIVDREFAQARDENVNLRRTLGKVREGLISLRSQIEEDQLAAIEALLATIESATRRPS